MAGRAGLHPAGDHRLPHHAALLAGRARRRRGQGVTPQRIADSMGNADGGHRAQGREEVVRLGERHRQRQPRDRRRRVRDLRRPLGQRQVDPAAAHRRPRGCHRRADRHRRRRRHQSGAGRARALDGVPVLRALSDQDGARQHELRPRGRAAAARRRSTRRVNDAAAILKLERLHGPQAQGAVAAASGSASPSAGPSCANRWRSCSTSRSPISMRRCASRCASRSPSCTSGSAPPWSTSRTTRSRR